MPSQTIEEVLATPVGRALVQYLEETLQRPADLLDATVVKKDKLLEEIPKSIFPADDKGVKDTFKAAKIIVSTSWGSPCFKFKSPPKAFLDALYKAVDLLSKAHLATPEQAAPTAAEEAKVEQDNAPPPPADDPTPAPAALAVEVPSYAPVEAATKALSDWKAAHDEAEWPAGAAVGNLVSMLSLVAACGEAVPVLARKFMPQDAIQTVIDMDNAIGSATRVALECVQKALQEHDAPTPADLAALRKFRSGPGRAAGNVTITGAGAGAGAGAGVTGAGSAASGGGGDAGMTLAVTNTAGLYPEVRAAQPGSKVAAWVAMTGALTNTVHRCARHVAGAVGSSSHRMVTKLLQVQGSVEALGVYRPARDVVDEPPMRILLLGSHSTKATGKLRAIDVTYSEEFLKAMRAMNWQYMSNVSFVPRPVGNADGFTSALLHSFPTDDDTPNFLPPHIVHISTHSDGKVLKLAEDGSQGEVTTQALIELLTQLDPKPIAIILNCCVTGPIMEKIFQMKNGLNCVIGTSKKIPNTVANAFSTFFYKALSFGLSLPAAFHFARANLPDAERDTMMMRCRPANADDQLAAWEDACHVPAVAVEDNSKAIAAMQQMREQLKKRLAGISGAAAAAYKQWQRCSRRHGQMEEIRSRHTLLRGFLQVLKASTGVDRDGNLTEVDSRAAAFVASLHGINIPTGRSGPRAIERQYEREVMRPVRQAFPGLASEHEGPALVDAALAQVNAELKAAVEARDAALADLDIQSSLEACMAALAEANKAVTGEEMDTDNDWFADCELLISDAAGDDDGDDDGSLNLTVDDSKDADDDVEDLADYEPEKPYSSNAKRLHDAEQNLKRANAMKKLACMMMDDGVLPLVCICENLFKDKHSTPSGELAQTVDTINTRRSQWDKVDEGIGAAVKEVADAMCALDALVPCQHKDEPDDSDGCALCAVRLQLEEVRVTTQELIDSLKEDAVMAAAEAADAKLVYNSDADMDRKFLKSMTMFNHAQGAATQQSLKDHMKGYRAELSTFLKQSTSVRTRVEARTAKYAKQKAARKAREEAKEQ